jgi:hypothetical protein
MAVVVVWREDGWYCHNADVLDADVHIYSSRDLAVKG